MFLFFFFALDSQIVPILYHHCQPSSPYPPSPPPPLFLTLPIKSQNQPFFFLFTNKTSNLSLHVPMNVEVHATFFFRMQHAPNLDYTPLLTMFLRIRALQG